MRLPTGILILFSLLLEFSYWLPKTEYLGTSLSKGKGLRIPCFVV